MLEAEIAELRKKISESDASHAQQVASLRDERDRVTAERQRDAERIRSLEQDYASMRIKCAFFEFVLLDLTGCSDRIKETRLQSFDRNSRASVMSSKPRRTRTNDDKPRCRHY